MGEAPAGRAIGTKTFVALMAVPKIVFLAGLLVMNNNYTSLQRGLTATNPQVSSLQSTVYSLNPN